MAKETLLGVGAHQPEGWRLQPRLGRMYRRAECFEADVAPGRDPIVSRIIWLRGLDWKNKNAFNRCIYIHGTPQEYSLGKKASYGCIRMRSNDVIEIFNWVTNGTDVAIVDKPMNRAVRDLPVEHALVATNVARPEERSEMLR